MSKVRSTPPSRSRTLRDESGIALIAALLVMLIIAMMAAAAVTVAVGASSHARTDVNRKNALEAAEAGLQVALYRLNMLVPSSGNCIGDTATAPTITTSSGEGWCQSSTYTLGNGSTYQYYTSTQLASGQSCVGYTVSGSQPIINRCITAVGISRGVVARSQIRAAAFAATPYFPVNGITGVNGINDNNNDYIGGGEASNGNITAANNVTITGGIELGPKGSFTNNGNGSPPTETLSSPIVLSPLDPGTSATNNDDYRIANGLQRPPSSPYDASSGISFNSTTRTLTSTSGHNPSLTLGGSIYNFCEVDLSNNVTINIATNAKVEIIIDSPYDPGSGCPQGTGNFNLGNNVTWNLLSKDPTQLQIYVYGTPPQSGGPTNTVTINNNNVCYCTIYAPWSTINLSHSSNNSGLTGAVSGAYVNVSNNFRFTWDSRAGTLEGSAQGLYYRTAWAQCTPSYSTSNPGAGCG